LNLNYGGLGLYGIGSPISSVSKKEPKGASNPLRQIFIMDGNPQDKRQFRKILRPVCGIERLSRNEAWNAFNNACRK